ncbi:MAG: efflux RND transporter periplasmic adaptor subunit [candidate division Zixibacteria bacterium]|nr:efflux RND transporter periplasmic adaptor subunit [candidate division Zixibacteria bacterium]
MTKKRKKTVWIVSAVVVVVGGLVTANMLLDGEEKTEVLVELASLDRIVEEVSASGRIQPQTKVNITSQVSGKIIGVFVNEGDRVSKDELLLQLDPVQLRSDLDQAQFSLDEYTARAEGAKTTKEQDEEEYERQENLYEKKLTSQTEFTNAKYRYLKSRANYTALKSQVRTQRARVEKAKDNLERTRITAPMDGVITFLNAEVGEISQAQTAFTQGKTLMTISDLSVFEVEVDVDETEIAQIELGQLAKIEVDAFRDTIFDGTVVEIGNSAIVIGQGTQDMTTNFRVKVRFDDSNVRLRPGMSATVDVTCDMMEDATLVPYAALVVREFDPDSLKKSEDDEDTSGGIFASDAVAAEPDANDSEENNSNKKSSSKKDKVKKTGVFVVRNGVARFVEIKTGIADQKNIAALSGISEGDTIVSGSFKTLRKIKDGDKVEIAENSLKELESDED